MGKIPGSGACNPFFLARPKENSRSRGRRAGIEGFTRRGSPEAGAALAGGPPAPAPAPSPGSSAAPAGRASPGPALTCGCGALPPPAHRYGLGWGLGADGGTGNAAPPRPAARVVRRKWEEEEVEKEEG